MPTGRRPEIFPADMIELVRKLYQDEERSQAEIADILKVKLNSVRRLMRRHGPKTRTPGEASRQRGQARTRHACKAPDCAKPPVRLGYCHMHYRQLRNGTLGLSYNKWTSPFRMRSTHTVHVNLRALWGPACDYPCIGCGRQASQWAYDGMDPTQLLGRKRSKASLCWYSLYPEFYMPMCTKCHRTLDGARMADELREYREWKLETGMTLADIANVRIGIPA